MSHFVAPRKRLGQNFLQDPNILRKIVAQLSLSPHDTVLEIGPGRGALTNLLIPQVKQMHIVEFDRDLIAYWQQRAQQQPNLIVHGIDILKFDLAQIPTDTPLKVIGNLPYNISTPVLFHLINYAPQIHSQILMLQKEVVQRMVSAPNCKQYGRLSVMLQQRYQIENLFTVPPSAFVPAPKVDSAVARLTPLATPLAASQSQADFALVVKQAFAQRRKTLRNTLKELLNAEQIASVDIDPSARAESIDIAGFVRLAEVYTQSQLLIK